jgi:hypothetical protein
MQAYTTFRVTDIPLKRGGQLTILISNTPAAMDSVQCNIYKN